MNLTIIGTGFVGVVSSAVFASFGHTVWGLDVDEAKVAKLNQGIMPFFEPGLEELVKESVSKKNLTFTTSYETAIKDADVIFIAVGTPSAADGQADLKYVFMAASSLATHLKEGAIVALKSTVPPGTCAKVEETIKAITKVRFSVVSLPEFLKEGSAVEDTLHPDRIIIGATEPDVIATLTELHKPLGAPVIVMKPESAQMCKYASNAYLATRITFINQISNLCEVNGANVLEVIGGIGFDKRIGSHYWYPGLGYGGSCFPKDVKELAAYARAVHQEDNLMVTISDLNEARIPSLLTRFETAAGGFSGKTIAMLGLSFKPNTDDLREAPSTKIIPALLEKGTVIQGYDPMATEAAKLWFAKTPGIERLSYAASVEEALRGADVVMLLVEWPELIALDPSEIAAQVKPGALFIDVRDQYTRSQIEAVGLRYIGIGV